MRGSSFPSDSEVRSWDFHRLSEYILQQGGATDIQAHAEKVADFFRRFEVGGDMFMSFSEDNLERLTEGYPAFIDTLLHLQGKDPRHSPQSAIPRLDTPLSDLPLPSSALASTILSPNVQRGSSNVETVSGHENCLADSFDSSSSTSSSSLSTHSHQITPNLLTTPPPEHAHTDNDAHDTTTEERTDRQPAHTDFTATVPKLQLSRPDHSIFGPVPTAESPLPEAFIMPGAFNPLTRHGNEHEGTRFSPATGTVSAVLFSTPPSQIDDTRVEDFEDATDRTSPSVVHIDEAQTRLMSSQGQDIGQGGESDDTDDIGEFDNIDDQDAEAGVEVVNVMLLTDGNDELPHSAPDTTKFPLTPTGSRDGPGRLPMTQTDIAGNVKPPRGEKVDSEPRISSLNASKHIDQSPLGVYNDRCPRMSGSDPEINQTLMQPYDDSGTYTPQSDSSVISTHDHTQAEVDQSQMRADVDGSSEIDGCSLLLVEDQQGEGRVDDAGGSQAQSNRGPSDLPEVAQIHVSSSDLSSSDLSSSDDSNRDGGPQLATDLDDPQSGSESSDNDNSGIAPLNHRNDDRQTGAPSDINNSDNLISDNHDIGPSSRFKMPLRIASLDPFPSFADSDEISPLIFRDESIHRDSTTDDRSPSDYTRSPGRVSFISHSGRTLFPSGCEGAHFRTRSARGKQKIECFDSGFAETISLLEERRSVEVGTQTDGTHISSAYVKGLERQILELKKDRSRLQAQVRKLEAAQRRPFFLRSWFGRSSAMPSRSQSPVRSQGVSTDSDIRGVKLR